MCIRAERQSEAQAADFEAITEAILEVEKQSNFLGEITKATETIRSQNDKIAERVRKSRASLERQVETLRERMADLKQYFGGERNGRLRSSIAPGWQDSPPERVDDAPPRSGTMPGAPRNPYFGAPACRELILPTTPKFLATSCHRSSPPSGLHFAAVRVPGVIVAIIVMVWLCSIGWPAPAAIRARTCGTCTATMPIDFRRRLIWPPRCATRARKAKSVRDDSELAGELAALLDAEIAAGSLKDDPVKLRYILCKALGEFEVPVGVPALVKAAGTRPAGRKKRWSGWRPAGPGAVGRKGRCHPGPVAPHGRGRASRAASVGRRGSGHPARPQPWRWE